MIRRAGPADGAVIAALEARCARDPWAEKAIDSTLALPSTMAWIAGDPPIGYLLASHAGGTAEILTVGVLPELRRGGVGRALLANAFDAWRRAGVEEAFLEVRRDNVAAMSLYRSLGWDEVAVRRGYYADGVDAAVMRVQVVALRHRTPDSLGGTD